MGDDADDVADELFRTAYDELRRLAHGLRRGHDAPTLNATALVHEAYIKLLGAKRFRAQSPEHLKYTLVRAMKYVLLDAARQKASARGGGGRAGRRVTLEDPEAQGVFVDPHEVLAVGSALDALARQNELQARAFELQFFGGLEIAEISRLMELSEKKVQRLLRVARATLAVLVGTPEGVRREEQ